MFENLGIYNSQAESEYDINKHIEQGAQFKKLGQMISSANEHHFLQESSGDEWGSVVDAYNGDNSTKKRGMIEGMTMSEDQVEFNNLISQYATLHRAYITTILDKDHTPAEKQAAETALLTKKNNILSAANQLNNKVQESDDSRAEIENALYYTQSDIRDVLSELALQKVTSEDVVDNYDNSTVIGALESSALNMNSHYYHVFVYLLIAATLLAFVFNLMVNPNANVLNAMYVLGALFAVYMISRHFVNS